VSEARDGVDSGLIIKHCKGLLGTNTLAYLSGTSLTEEKRLMASTLGRATSCRLHLRRRQAGKKIIKLFLNCNLRISKVSKKEGQ
jgi:hypothetical protein